MAGSVLQGKGFAVSFSHREITAWGGLAPFKRMLNSMGFREGAGWGLRGPKSNRGCAPLQLIEQFIASIGCRVCRFVHAETVRMDGALVRLFGWITATGHRPQGHRAIVRSLRQARRRMAACRGLSPVLRQDQRTQAGDAGGFGLMNRVAACDTAKVDFFWKALLTTKELSWAR